MLSVIEKLHIPRFCYRDWKLEGAPRVKNVKNCVAYEGIFEGGYRHSASGLGVRWVVAIDPTRVRVPARALLFVDRWCVHLV